jgi:mRNA interferase RelE/StbE
MSYTVELLPAARRQLKKLPRHAQKQIQTVIETLAKDPRPHGYKPLHGRLKAFFRMDSGDYRVIYEIHDNILRVLVVKVGDRRDVYR